MISNTALSDRLNAVKNGSPLPAKDKPTKQLVQEKATISTFNSILVFFDLFVMSFFYGYGICSVFSLDWNLFACFSVGILFNKLVFYLPKMLLPKYINKE
ncbi:MAG TPA: hypothetical protein PKW61_02060 [Tenuifilaceae bacterium]|nr:hypothetical protein [Tenuifilaceae bacterium]